MNRVVPTLVALPLILGLMSGCSQDSNASEAQRPGVPSGVQEQYDVLSEELAEKGQTIESGEWTVHLITEAAEPWFEIHGAQQPMFHEPQAGETNHIEIIPTETSTGRIVPDVPITLEVVDATGELVQEKKLNFYYSTFFHYANNFSIAEPGAYTLRAKLGTPTFNRHGDEADGPALATGTTVEFTDVELGTS